MKKYTGARVGLLIGLLSLNTLSACIDTRQELGAGERVTNRKAEQILMMDDSTSGLHCTPPQNITCRAITKFALIACLCSGVTWGLTNYFANPENTTDLAMHNSSSLTTSESFMPIELYKSIMPCTKKHLLNERVIINAIQKDPADLVAVRQSSDWVTDGSLDNGVILEDPMVLDNCVLSDLKANGFSKERIKYWLAQGLNIDAQDERGRTLLMYSPTYSNKRTLQFLIDKGANVNAQDKNGNTLFHRAVGGDCLDLAKRLAQVKNIDLNVINNDGRTALHLVILYSYTDMLNVLLETSGIVVNIKDKDGYTPLCLAIKLGRLSVAERLVQVPGIDFNVIDNDKRTLLHWVAKRGYVSLIEAILGTKNKIDINAKDKDGNTALHLALDLRRVAIGNRLIQTENIDLNVINNDKKTFLHLAAKRDILSVVRAILDKNIININAKDKDGNTALHLAISYRSKHVMNYLIKMPNIDFKTPNNNKETSVYLAAKEGYLRPIEASLGYNIAVDQKFGPH